MRNVLPCGFPAFSALPRSSAKTSSFCSLLFYDCSYTMRIKDKKPIRPHSSCYCTYPPRYARQGVPMYSMHITIYRVMRKTWLNGFHSLPVPFVHEAISSPGCSHKPERYNHHKIARQLLDKAGQYPAAIIHSRPAPTEYRVAAIQAQYCFPFPAKTGGR